MHRFLPSKSAKKLTRLQCEDAADHLLEMLDDRSMGLSVSCIISGERHRIPRHILRISLVESLSSHDGANCLHWYVKLRSILDFDTHANEVAGIGISNEGVGVFQQASSGNMFWNVEDIFSTYELAAIRQQIRRLEDAETCKQHYESRRKEANAAIAKKSLRRQVFERHGEACIHCGATSDLAIDHIVPVSHGGNDEIENLQVLCRRCNSSKGAGPDIRPDGLNTNDPLGLMFTLLGVADESDDSSGDATNE